MKIMERCQKLVQLQLVKTLKTTHTEVLKKFLHLV